MHKFKAGDRFSMVIDNCKYKGSVVELQWRSPIDGDEHYKVKFDDQKLADEFVKQSDMIKLVKKSIKWKIGDRVIEKWRLNGKVMSGEKGTLIPDCNDDQGLRVSFDNHCHLSTYTAPLLNLYGPNKWFGRLKKKSKYVASNGPSHYTIPLGETIILHPNIVCTVSADDAILKATLNTNKKLQDKIEELKHEIVCLKKIIDNSEDATKSQLNTLQETLAGQIEWNRKYCEEINKLKKENKYLEDAMTFNSNANVVYFKENRELKRALENEKRRVSFCEDSIEIHNQTIDELEREINKLKEDVKTLEAINSYLRENREVSTNSFSQRLLDSALAENKELKEQLAIKQKVIFDNSVNERLRIENIGLKEKITDLISKIERCKSVIELLQSTNRNLLRCMKTEE